MKATDGDGRNLRCCRYGEEEEREGGGRKLPSTPVLRDGGDSGQQRILQQIELPSIATPKYKHITNMKDKDDIVRKNNEQRRYVIKGKEKDRKLPAQVKSQPEHHGDSEKEGRYHQQHPPLVSLQPPARRNLSCSTNTASTGNNIDDNIGFAIGIVVEEDQDDEDDDGEYNDVEIGMTENTNIKKDRGRQEDQQPPGAYPIDDRRPVGYAGRQRRLRQQGGGTVNNQEATDNQNHLPPELRTMVVDPSSEEAAVDQNHLRQLQRRNHHSA